MIGRLGWGRLKAFLARVVIARDDVCWEWQGNLNADGYGYVNYSGFPNLVHRLMWMIHNGREIEHGHSIRHTCDNPKCVNPAHLIQSTHAQSMEDMAKKGRASKRKGEDNPNSKLTEGDVRSIKLMIAAGEGRRKTAKEHDISLAAVDRIVNGKSWTHLR